jgi:hypothetical protein
MSNYIKYSATQRRLAKDNGQGLFTAAVDGLPCKRNSLAYQGPMDYETAQKLTCFCIIVGEGDLSPKQAFDKTFGNKRARK